MMEIATEVIMSMKQKKKSQIGYGLQKESEALVKHILLNMVKSTLPDMKPDTKNEEDSIKYREEGNQYFIAGEDEAAIISYTKSLAYADTNEQMAQAYANRSAALYRKRMFKECVIDIDTALELGYPKEKCGKLKERGIKALAELKKIFAAKSKNVGPNENANENSSQQPVEERSSEVTENISEIKKCPLIKKVEENGLEENSENKSDGSEARLMYNLKLHKPTRKLPKPRHLLDPQVMALAYGPSKEAPANSDGIRISYSGVYGRHLVATRDFRPGDLITSEEPYSWILYQDKFYTHCHHCLERCYNLIPCPKCPLVQYCSKECRKASWEMAHRIECPVLSVLFNLLDVDEERVRTLMIMKIMRFVLTVTERGKKISELREDLKIAEPLPDPRTAGFTEEGILDSKSARSALSLATNVTTRPLVGVCAFACISAFTTILLATQSDFFGKKYDATELANIDELSDLRFCGSIMFRACLVVSSNCFSMQLDPGVKSGSGLYVVHSLYNHACAANTFRHFEGLRMLTRAQEPIRAGDQIFTGYGADHATMTLNERKAKLMEQYYFECQCPACVNDWPSYADILKHHVGSISKNKALVDELEPYRERLLKDKYDVDAVKTVIEILHGATKQPCEEILFAVQYLKSYYLGKMFK